MTELPNTVEAGGEPFTEAQVIELEKMIGLALPSDYREIILQYGSVFPKEDDAVVEIDWRRIDGEPLSKEDREEFETLYLFYGSWSEKNIRETYERIHLHDGRQPVVLPKQFLPIGHDTGGTLYLLDLSVTGGGSVWAWGKNLNDPWLQGINLYIGFVAYSFTDLIANRLKPVPEDW